MTTASRCGDDKEAQENRPQGRVLPVLEHLEIMALPIAQLAETHLPALWDKRT